jgi:hypothetical protein
MKIDSLLVPPFDVIFGRQLPRLRGITTWDHVSVLGKANIERLVQLAQESVYALLAEGSSREDLKTIREGIGYLTELLATEPNVKPLLPRLRVENFRKGDAVVIYVGDSPDTTAQKPWVDAIITDVSKSYRAEWADCSPNSGYYWRLTATPSTAVFADQETIAFSTSEPRVIPADDFDYLTCNRDNDSRFINIYAANACRSWLPLWCLERGNSQLADMEMKTWLYSS